MKLIYRMLGVLLVGMLHSLCAIASIPVVLSTDVGNEVDDQWAITYMLTNPEFEVLGIVSAHAPSLPNPSAHYTYEILRDVVENRLNLTTHPPLLEGASLPLSDSVTARPSSGLDFLLAASNKFSKEHRLTVLTIGAATDVASAILRDPTVVNRIEVVAMGFKSLTEGGHEYNVENDPRAWQVILDSTVPVTVGAADVCRANLSLTLDQAMRLISPHGSIGEWLWDEYQAWYFRFVKPLRKDDFSKPWVIWDIVTLAYKLGMTSSTVIPRPSLADDLSFKQLSGRGSITWIIGIDSSRMWADFLGKIDAFQSTHRPGLRSDLIHYSVLSGNASGTLRTAREPSK